MVSRFILATFVRESFESLMARSASRSASIRPSMRASTALTSSRSLAARSSRALNAASHCAWEGGLAAVWAVAAILLHASSAMREQERTRNNFMDVVRLEALDEVCFGKGSAHRLPVVLRGRDGQPLWITRAGRVMVVKTCVPFLRRKEALSNDHRCKMPLFWGWRSSSHSA